MKGPEVFPPAFAQRSGSHSMYWRLGVACALFVTVACNSSSRRAHGSSVSRDSTASDAAVLAIADTQHVVLRVKGMYCASCESTVAAMLRRTPGVVTANVNVTRGEAAVTYDSARTSPTKLVNVITSLGYTASVHGT